MTPQQRNIVTIAAAEGTVDMARLQSRSGFTRRTLRELAGEAGYLVALPQEHVTHPKRYKWTGKEIPADDGRPTRAKKQDDGTTVRFKAPLSSRRRMFDPDQPVVQKKKPKFTLCKSSPVYSNVQVAPGERVPVIFRGMPGLDPMTGRPW